MKQDLEQGRLEDGELAVPRKVRFQDSTEVIVIPEFHVTVVPSEHGPRTSMVTDKDDTGAEQISGGRVARHMMLAIGVSMLTCLLLGICWTFLWRSRMKGMKPRSMLLPWAESREYNQRNFVVD